MNEEAINDSTLEIFDIEIEEAFPFAGDGSVSHPLLKGKEFSDQHPISAITGLRDELDSLKATDRVYSNESGLGEFRRWHDGNPDGEDRSGYFVSIVPGTDEIQICDFTHDVYGVSVNNSGFVGNQNGLYQKGKDIVSNYANSTSYAIVGIVGAMRVRTDGKARNGEYVVPNAYGEATLSENNYGYKVLSQGSYPSYNYVTVAMTPQSDALSRLQDSASGGNLGEFIIKINGIEESVGGLEIKVDASKEDIEDILGEIDGLQVQVTTAQDVANSALENAESAKKTASDAVTGAAQAAQDARDAADGAISSANQALSDAMDLKNQLQPILGWDDNEGLSNGVQGFVTQADEDHALLASLMIGNFPDGTNLAAIIQKVDQNGAMIQHLTSHIDKYSVGAYSTTYGLTYNEAKSILTQEHIYVPTETHEESMDIVDEETGEFIGQGLFTFEKPDTHAYRYKWIPFDEEVSGSGKWQKEERIVPTATSYINSDDIIDVDNNKLAIDDLWYCKSDVIDVPEGVNPLEGGNLYIWTGYMWDWVASEDDNYQSRVIVSMKQTDEAIISDVVALDGRATGIEQNVNSITTRVNDAEGNISVINQEVDSIQSTISTMNGNISSLQQYADESKASFTAITYGTFPRRLQNLRGSSPESYDGKKYTMPPVWDDEAGTFVFDDKNVSEYGAYYFSSEDQTRYCYVYDGGYDIYTVGKEVTAMLDNRITENEASIGTLVEFKQETKERVDALGKDVQTNTESLANIDTRVSKNEASITTLTSRYYHAMLSASETEVPMYGENKYTMPPEWDELTRQYQFNDRYISEDGTYYMADENSQSYCKVVALEDGTVLYETYGLVDSSIAAIEQRVDDNSSSIGLVVERVENVIDENGQLTDESISSKGSIIIEAINDESVATINADRIELTGTDKISLTVSTAESNAISKATELANTAESNAEATAQTLASNAEANANGYTDGQLTNYPTTTIMNSAITQTANQITSSVEATYATKDSLGNYVTTTKLTEIEQRIDDNTASIGLVVKDGEVSGSVIIEAINGESTAQIEADRVNIAASKVISAIVSNGEVTPASIVAAINDSESTVKISGDHIKITADSIDLTASEKFSAVVDADGNVTPASIVAAINDGESSIVIDADHINLNGYVTVTDLSTGGSTTINGDNITTGTISASRIDLTDYSTSSEIQAYISSVVGGMKLSVMNGAESSTISLTSNGIALSSQTIEFTGYVTFTDLATRGSTIINGDNITTGSISADKISPNNNGNITFGSSLYFSNNFPTLYNIGALSFMNGCIINGNPTSALSAGLYINAPCIDICTGTNTYTVLHTGNINTVTVAAKFG